jgi:hypothetical protein
VFDGEIFAREGGLFPVGGPWVSSFSSCSVNNSGDWAFAALTGSFSSPIYVFMLNGAVLAHMGGKPTPRSSPISSSGSRFTTG